MKPLSFIRRHKYKYLWLATIKNLGIGIFFGIAVYSEVGIYTYLIIMYLLVSELLKSSGNDFDVVNKWVKEDFEKERLK